MALEITPDRLRAAAARLHEDGWLYSARQLYYAVCADLETAPVRMAAGELGLGVLLILVGAITGQRLVLQVLGAAGAVLVVVGAVTRLRERRPLPISRALALSYADFEEHLRAAAGDLPGLVAPAVPSALGSVAAPLVLCDRPDTAAVLVANLTRVGDVHVAVRGAEPDDVRGRRIVVLHDCDPAGCGLVAELRDRGAEVVDAGINPGELSGRRLQMIEGAPARLPRDLSAHLDTAQVDWLRSGRRLECATETPGELAQRVRAAVAAG